MTIKTVFRLAHVPPSTNGLFANVAGKGRIRSERYRSWANAAGWDLKRQRIAKFECPVYLTIAIGKLSQTSDVSNRVKAIEDLLVEHGIIPGDSIKWVRGVNVYLSPIEFEGVEIAIVEADKVGEAA